MRSRTTMRRRGPRPAIVTASTSGVDRDGVDARMRRDRRARGGRRGSSRSGARSSTSPAVDEAPRRAPRRSMRLRPGRLVEAGRARAVPRGARDPGVSRGFDGGTPSNVTARSATRPL
jgi:hypothetical protein